MIVSENQELKSRFIDGLRESYDEREGIHVSDLIYCMREACFRRLFPKPPTERQLSFFLDGARRHVALQSLTGLESEVIVEAFGVKGTVDIQDGTPVEFKSTRAPKAIPDHYYKQLGYYCVLSGTDNGVLMIQRINNRESPFEFYNVQYNREDLENMRTEICNKQRLLSDAIINQSVHGLPLPNEDWKCRDCLYKNECREDLDGGGS